MPIYTKTGDRGETGIFGGKRLPKSDLQIDTYGTIDELTSFLGMTILKIKDQSTKDILTHIQRDLYQIMGVLAGADTSLTLLSPQISTFEKKIDEMDEKLPSLNRFILPGGTEEAAWFHIVRTICRNAERKVVELVRTKEWNNQSAHIIIQYLNRLSDLFFTFARWYNNEKEIVT